MQAMQNHESKSKNRPQIVNVVKKERNNESGSSRPQAKHVVNNNANNNDIERKHQVKEVRDKFIKSRVSEDEFKQIQRWTKLCGEKSSSDFIRTSVQMRINQLNKLKFQLAEALKVNGQKFDPKYSGNYSPSELELVISAVSDAFKKSLLLDKTSESELYQFILNWLRKYMESSINNNLLDLKK